MVAVRRSLDDGQIDPRAAMMVSAPVSAAGAATTPDWGYDPGGQVGALHAEIARRLHAAGVEPVPAPVGSPYDSVIRSLSVLAGYGTLAAGYGAVALAGYYWAAS